MLIFISNHRMFFGGNNESIKSFIYLIKLVSNTASQELAARVRFGALENFKTANWANNWISYATDFHQLGIKLPVSSCGCPWFPTKNIKLPVSSSGCSWFPSFFGINSRLHDSMCAYLWAQAAIGSVCLQSPLQIVLKRFKGVFQWLNPFGMFNFHSASQDSFGDLWLLEVQNLKHEWFNISWLTIGPGKGHRHFVKVLVFDTYKVFVFSAKIEARSQKIAAKFWSQVQKL